jgi:hypothetical protein
LPVRRFGETDRMYLLVVLALAFVTAALYTAIWTVSV